MTNTAILSGSLYFKITRALTYFLLTIGLVGCTGEGLRIGVMQGPDTEFLQFVKTIVLKEHGVRIKIVKFSDHQLLNKALHEGGLDANIFQHQLYLQEALKDKKYNLTAIGKTFIYPMGVYSCKFTHLEDIQRHATIAIPSDPTNQSRALRLLEKSGLIKLDIDSGTLVTPKSVRYNPKELQFKIIEATQLSHALQEDVDLAVIPSNYAVAVGLYPKEHALFIENQASYNPYATLIVVREADKTRKALQQLASAYRDEEVLAYAHQMFKDGAIPT
jgi:D-methionine transport system substrate-binding protein